MSVAEVVTLIAACGAFLVAAAGAFVSIWNAVHLQQVHTIVNSQATKFEDLTHRLGMAEGELQGALPRARTKVRSASRRVGKTPTLGGGST